jgi:hypothetical protein
MALNPMLDAENKPLMYPSEVIVDSQAHCFASIEFTNNTVLERSMGTVFLTNARLVFVNSEPENTRLNFGLHFNLISEEHFTCIGTMGVFQGTISPYANFMPASGKFKIEIQGGNLLMFRRQVINFIKQIRMVCHSPAVQNSNALHQAYVDPRDPDVMIVVDKDENQTGK